MFGLSTKHLVAAAKFLVAATKKLFVVPNFVAVTKSFSFPCRPSFIGLEVTKKNIKKIVLVCTNSQIKTLLLTF